jgi:hypothetical protein
VVVPAVDKSCDLPFDQEWAPAERWAWKLIRAGNIADFGKYEPTPTDPGTANEDQQDTYYPLSASFLFRVLTDESIRECLTARGVWIRRARFDACVDLSNIEIGRPLRLEGCHFRGGLSLRWARVDDVLSLDGSVVEGTVPSRGYGSGRTVTLDMRGLRAASNILIRNKARIAGDALLVGAWIERTLEVTDGTRVEGAFDAGGLKTGESVLLVGDAVFEGPVSLAEARIGLSLRLSGSTFKMHVNVAGATIGGSLAAEHAIFEAPVDLGGSKIGLAMIMVRAHFKSELILIETQADGAASLNGAVFENGANMHRLNVQTLYMGTYRNENEERSTVCNGQLALTGASIKGDLDIGGAHLPADAVLNLTGATVGGELRLGLPPDGQPAWGHGARLVLRNVKAGAVYGWFDGRDASRNHVWPEERCLELDGLTYDRLGGWRGWPDGGATGDVTAFQPATWHTDWLRLNGSDSLQQYQYLARILREVGAEKQANEVLYAGRERERARALEEPLVLPGWRWSWAERKLEWRPFRAHVNLPVPRLSWSGQNKQLRVGVSPVRIGGWRWLGLSLLRYIVGYGIGRRYFYVVLWMLGFVGIGVAILLVSGPTHQQLDGVWAKIAYSLAQLLPVAQLERFFQGVELTGGARLYFILHKLAGWILGLFLIAALAGLTQRR